MSLKGASWGTPVSIYQIAVITLLIKVVAVSTCLFAGQIILWKKVALRTDAIAVTKSIVGTRVTSQTKHGQVDNVSSRATNNVGAVVRDWPITRIALATAFIVWVEGIIFGAGIQAGGILVEVDGTRSTAVRIKTASSYCCPWIVVIKDRITSAGGWIVFPVIYAAVAGQTSKTVATSIAIVGTRQAVHRIGLEVSPFWTWVNTYRLNCIDVWSVDAAFVQAESDENHFYC